MTSTTWRNDKLEEWKVMSATEIMLVKLLDVKTLIGRIRPFPPKIEQSSRRICPKDRKRIQTFRKDIPLMKTMHKILQKRGMMLSFPKYPKTMIEMKVWALEKGNIISGLTLILTTQKISDTKKWILPENGNSVVFYLSFFGPLFSVLNK